MLKYTELPRQVYIGFISYKVYLFIPRPMRCGNCQRFSHRTNQCTAPPRCVKCGDNHEYKDCTITDKTRFLCINCDDDHSAASADCPQFKTVQLSLEIRAKQHKTYKEALLQAKECIIDRQRIQVNPRLPENREHRSHTDVAAPQHLRASNTGSGRVAHRLNDENTVTQ